MSKLERLGELSEQEALDLCVELAMTLCFDDYIAMVRRTIDGDAHLATAVRDVAQAVYDKAFGVSK